MHQWFVVLLHPDFLLLGMIDDWFANLRMEKGRRMFMTQNNVPCFADFDWIEIDDVCFANPVWKDT